MRPEQLGDFAVPSDAFAHPDGTRVVFTVTTMDLDDDVYVRRVWLWDGAEARPFTSGRSDFSPRWSPDGETLAFLRKGPGDDDKPQLALMPAGGGEATVVTDLDGGVSDLAWSPDGTRIALATMVFLEELDDDERQRAPRRITDPAFRFDNIGWTHDRRTHIAIHDIARGTTESLTDGDFSETGIAWSPEGDTIAYLSATADDRWVNPLGRVYTIATTGGEPKAVTPRGSWSWTGYAPDGTLYAIGQVTESITLAPDQVHRIDGDGPIRLTDLDRNLMPGHPAGVLARPRFIGDAMTCVLEDAGTQRVVSIGTDGSVVDIAGGRRLITGWDPIDGGSGAVFTATDPLNPGEVYLWEGGHERPLTGLNTDFATAAELVAPEPFSYESDGATIHGWVYLPEGDAKVPLLFNIHGGPATQYGWGFFDEFQVYVGAGYGVVAVNPRGSSGYGYDHVAVPCGRWDEAMPPDMADLMAAPDAAAESFPRLDRDNVGIMGGSYGGLSTAMITSLDQRYRSAVAERGVYNWVSMAGTSDIPFFMELYLGTTMPEGAERMWKASALSRAHAITTPTLVLHSETDYRCPIEQGQQLFSLLYGQGVDTELLLFPSGEGHELSRSGKPKHRVERFEAILDWHARHLGA